MVIDTLRDLRRRFQVDSDRVFLFGWEQGADAALDIGMSHPDQFAGVLFGPAFSGLPLILCGSLKIIYDLALLYTCRHVKPPEESPGNGV